MHGVLFELPHAPGLCTYDLLRRGSAVFRKDSSGLVFWTFLRPVRRHPARAGGAGGYLCKCLLTLFPYQTEENSQGILITQGKLQQISQVVVGRLCLLFVLKLFGPTSREDQKSGHHDLDFHLHDLSESHSEFS